VQGLLEFAKTLGAPRIAAMAAVTLALVGFFAFLILRVTAPQMTPLFTDLSYEDSSAIVKDLERQGVVYELRNDGGTVMVPKDRVARLRMSLAGEGLPKGGGVGYEIFDKSDALGTTSFIQNINNLRALEGELARTIRGLDRVVAARVHLVLPERPLFSRDKVDPSASIVLKVHGALEPQQVRAIRHLVASAVNGLKPQRVSIVDEAGRLLAGGTGNDEFAESRSTRSFPPSSAPAARVSKSAPISISIASPRPRTNSIRKVAWCVRARRGRRHPQPRAATIR
jgi:flagellar M-ring protein FliF